MKKQPEASMIFFAQKSEAELQSLNRHFLNGVSLAFADSKTIQMTVNGIQKKKKEAHIC